MGEATPLRLTDVGLVLDVWVVPGAARTEIRGTHDGAVRIRVAAPPSEGAANRALTKFLGNLLGCAVSLERGMAARRKQVRIDSDDLGAVAKKLGVEAE